MKIAIKNDSINSNDAKIELHDMPMNGVFRSLDLSMEVDQPCVVVASMVLDSAQVQIADCRLFIEHLEAPEELRRALYDLLRGEFE